MHRLRRTITLALWSALVGVSMRPTRADAQPAASAPPFAFEGVTVIDVSTGERRSAQTVLIVGTRIAAVGAIDRVQLPAGAHRIDARGKYLIPGLWDMHAHLMRPLVQLPALYLANGITGLRDLGNDQLYSTRFRLRPAPGPDGLTPRVLVAGPPLDGPGTRPGNRVVTTEADARRVVDSLVAVPVDFLKLYQVLPPALHAALGREAKRVGLPFVGHIPSTMSAAQVSDAGQRSIEHLFELPLSCSTREAELRAAQVAAIGTEAYARVRTGQTAALVESYDPAKCAAVAAHLARNGTWVTPTLHLAPLFAAVDSALEQDTRIRVVPAAMRDRWKQNRPTALPILSGPPAERRQMLNVLTDILRQLHRAGVPLLAGTDAPIPYVIPGFSLHEELAAMVGAGLTPLEALRTATLNPAKFLNATDSLGTVAPGKLADLVLLDGDPLRDIRNTARIAAVVTNGRYLDRASLEALIGFVEREANPPAGR